MKKSLLLVTALSTLILTGCTWTNQQSQPSQPSPAAIMQKQDTMIQQDDAIRSGSMMSGSSTGMMKNDKIMKKQDAMMRKNSMKK